MRLINGQVIGYFGNKADNLHKNGLYDTECFEKLIKKIGCDQLFFLKQTHSRDVFLLDQKPEKAITTFVFEGDALITNQKNIGIGVVTADCLPLFIIDSKKNAIGVIHAGWKGLSLNIISVTIEKMQKAFNCVLSDLKIYLGPSAEKCCYEVKEDFFAHFDHKMIEKRNGKLFFDPKTCALNELKENGIALSQIHVDYHRCTICNPEFCSVRREKENPGRQPSVIYIKG